MEEEEKTMMIARQEDENDVIPKLILDQLYEIANINSDLKKRMRDLKKGIITYLLKTGCVTLSQFTDRIAPFGDAYVRIVAVNGVHFYRPRNREKFSNYLLVYQQYLKDVEQVNSVINKDFLSIEGKPYFLTLIKRSANSIVL